MKWEIIDTGTKSAEENMQLDAEFLASLPQKKNPILHLYDWERDSATFGYFTHPFRYLDEEAVKRVDLALARRPTGGGIVFHTRDLAFSVLIPSHLPFFSENTLENYAFVNRIVQRAVSEFLGEKEDEFFMTKDDFTALDSYCTSFCMARPTRYDVMWRGKKVAGAAQRKTKHGFLHQGTISITAPSSEYLAQVLKKESRVQEAMQEYTCSLLPQEISGEEFTQAKKELEQIVIQNFTRTVP